MKKIVFLAASAIFCLNVMAQDSKVQTRSKPTKQIVKTPSGEAKVVTTTPVSTPVSTTAATTANQSTPDDVMKVNTEKYDFGKIKQGVPVTYAFELKNISKKPLVVENTYASCGCTTPEKIVEPIAPGATAKLKVQYNAAGMGPFSKDVHIKLAGITQEKLVHISGEVVSDPSASTPTEAKPNN